MGYLQEFQTRIANSDSTGVVQLWEEYCAGDQVDAIELKEILEAFRSTPLESTLGQQVEAILPLWSKIEDADSSHDVLRLIVDVQNTNSEELAKIVFSYLKNKFAHHTYFNEKMRLIGLRTKETYQGAIRNYELLTHLDEGKYVYHTGGWGTGEIVDISLIREELVLEFELVLGRRDMTFANAFKNLVPLEDKHFLARRFGNPDQLEADAKASPVQTIRDLLRDLGPKTAAEIKEELYELVIPADDWTKWWQSTRSKVKKDTMIATPASIREPFQLRDEEVTHEERFQNSLQNKTDASELIQAIYQFTRDFPETLKNADFKDSLRERLLDLFKQHNATLPHKFQLLLFLENLFNFSQEDLGVSTEDFVRTLEDVEEIINRIDIVAFKKKALVALRQFREDWPALFLSLLLTIPQGVLRDYLIKELHQHHSQEALQKRISHLVEAPTLYPEAYVWYFQKITGGNTPDYPYNDEDGQCRLFESFLILYHYLEQDPEYRDLVKKMYTILSADRYVCVRNILQGSTLEYAKEILLLVTKCQTFSNHDVKILHSLAEVVHPSLGEKSRKNAEDEADDVIWTTQEGYTRMQERIHQIGTVETVENAKEIEAARALGDLRENSEYKFALEKRSRLQGELKLLSEQLNKARILTKEDIEPGKVGVGTVVDIETQSGDDIHYTILGPWEADPDQHVLSFQSKFAQCMTGHALGDRFSFQGEEYKITGLKSYL